MALFTVLKQGGGEREIRNLAVIEVIVEEEGGKQWALTDTAVSIITAKCDTMREAIINAHGRARREIHCKQLTCTFCFYWTTQHVTMEFKTYYNNKPVLAIPSF